MGHKTGGSEGKRSEGLEAASPRVGAGVGMATAEGDAVLRPGQSNTLVSPSLRDAPQRLPEGVQFDYPGARQPAFKEVRKKVQAVPTRTFP